MAKNIDGKSMLEVELTGQCGYMTTWSGRNGLDLKKWRRQYLDKEDTYSYGYY